MYTKGGQTVARVVLPQDVGNFYLYLYKNMYREIVMIINLLFYVGTFDAYLIYTIITNGPVVCNVFLFFSFYEY